MNVTLPSQSQEPPNERTLRREEQLRGLRFLDTFQDMLAGCRDEPAVCSAALSRLAVFLEAQAACLARYDPIGNTLDLTQWTGARADWDTEQFRRAVLERRTISNAEVVAVPVMYQDGLYGDGTHHVDDANRHVWGVLAISRSESALRQAERQTLRAAASRLAAELERRETRLLENVLDSLLRKTKPIDVYTHALRELRRFVRYDHGSSVLTMQRGIGQMTVRAEKIVALRGTKETLLDGPRSGRVVLLSVEQTDWLGTCDAPFLLVRSGSDFRIEGADCEQLDPVELWRVLGTDEATEGAAVLCYPLVFGGQILGILRMSARRGEAFDPANQYFRILERFARLLSVTLYRSELYHQSDRQLQAIKEIGRAITGPVPVEEICERVLQLALRVLRVEVGVVGLLNGDDTLDLVAHRGCSLAAVPALSIHEGIVGSVLREGRSRAVPDVELDPDYVPFNTRVRSELVAPITYNREVIGFLDVESFEKGRFREEDEEVITFLEALANQAAIAIKTAQLHFEALKRLGSSVSIDPALSSAGLQDLLIQELRHKIEQLGSANERLAVANQAKSEFLARMSHDLRGPLNVIIGLANLLTDPSVGPGLSSEKRFESLGVIRSSGEVLSSLIGNILDLSALEAGKVELLLQPVDAQAAFGYLRSMATTLAQEGNKRLSISVQVQPEVGIITVDEQKFMRVMMNLISNAIKFTQTGGSIEVRATVEPGHIPGKTDALHVTVADTGPGIPPEHHDAVFEPFRRIDSTGGGRQGTGLGLAVVRQLVELHEGRVWVESDPGSGSEFHVQFPNALFSGRLLEADRAPEPGRIAGSSALRPGARSKGMILVVEDTTAHMDLMRLAVTSRGYDMHGVGSGEEALAWLDDHRPDVILLDMQLPGIDGFEVAARVKGKVETHGIPLVAVTADALSDAEERARASGCEAFLTKPIDLARLLATIDTVTS